MKSKKLPVLILFLSPLATGLSPFATNATDDDDLILSYTVDAASQDVQLYWKDDKGEILSSIQNLKTYAESKGQTLVFAMNGGMFKRDHSPQGLFIQQQQTLAPLDTSSGDGNFYLKPNGVFYITTGNAPAICTTADFQDNGAIKYATQSGPMLVIDGAIHPVFREGSRNLNIRNGVGILPDGNAVFAMSKTEINLYDFASWFKRQGCRNALYLDGAISRTYLPEKNWIQTDGEFGVIIGITKPDNK